MKRIWQILIVVGIIFLLSGTALSGAALAVNPELRYFPREKAAYFQEKWQRIYEKLDGRTETDIISEETEAIAMYEEHDWDTWEEHAEKQLDNWEHDMEHYWEEWEHEWKNSHVPDKEDVSGYQDLKAGDSFQNVQEIKIRAGKRQVILTEDASVSTVTVIRYEPGENGQGRMQAKISGNTLKLYEFGFSEELSSEQWKEKLKELLKTKEKIILPVEESTLPVLEILVPQNFDCEKIQLQIQNGTLIANGVAADEIELECAGNAEFYDCQVQEFDVKNVGLLYFSGDISEKADIELVSSTAEVLLDGEKEDFYYDIECVNSTVNLDGTAKSGVAFQLKEGNPSAAKIEIECVVSEVTIAFQ